MPGVQIFEYTNVSKESTKGTAVAPTRQLQFGGTGVLDIDPSLNFHENENRGQRIRIVRATQQAIDVNLKLATVQGIPIDNIPYLASMAVRGNVTPTAAGNAITWDHTVLSQSSNTNAPDAFTFDVGDDVQNFRVEYGMARSLKFSAARGDVLQAELDVFGRQPSKVAKATPAANASPILMMPGDQFKLKTAGNYANLASSSNTTQTNMLLDWDLMINSGLAPRHYMDGNLYFAQHVETDVEVELNMTVESNATAISQFYDRWLSQTLDFVRLEWTGPLVAGTAINYKLTFDMSVLYSKVEPISGEEDGANLYKIAARGAIGTDPRFFGLVVVNALTAL